MARPSDKSAGIDRLISLATGRDRRKTIEADHCTLCGSQANEFRDATSRKEYTISGMCQGCQDKVFD